MHKRGLLENFSEFFVGLLLGAMMLGTLWLLGSYVYDLAFSEDSIDQNSYSHFETLANSIESKYNNPLAVEEVPYQLKKDLVIVAFNKEQEFVPGHCQGLNVNVARPERGCNGACLCICDESKKEQMCNVESAKCRPFEPSLDFRGDCNIALSNGEVKFVLVESIEGKIELQDKEYDMSLLT